MAQAKKGDRVRVHYTGTLQDGSTFDTSRGGGPLEFTLGSGEVIPGLDAEVTGMEVGEEKSVTVPSAVAYGDHDASRAQTVPRARIPDDVALEIGTRLKMESGEGRTIAVTVTEISDESVVLDANHPLAGQDLTFTVELIEIV